MKNTKLKRLGKVVLAIGTASFVMGVFGHGCGNLKSNDSAGGSSLGAGNCKAEGFENIQVTPGQSTISLMYGNAVLKHYASCTGMGSESDLAVKTNLEYQQRSNAFSEYGSALDVTAPMLMGSLAVAGEVCDDVFDKEVELDNDARAVFKGWSADFGGGACPSDAVIDATIARMAFSCWSVSPDDLDLGGGEVTVEEAVNRTFADEVRAIKEGLSLIGGNERACAITLCSAMLSSLRGLLASQ